MKHMKGIIMLATLLLSLYGMFWMNAKSNDTLLNFKINNSRDVINLFPKTGRHIESQVNQSIKSARKHLAAIIELADDQRTFANTAKALDNVQAMSDLAVINQVLKVMSLVNTDKNLSKVVDTNLIKIQDFYVDNIENNKELYRAFKAYAHHGPDDEALTKEQQYFLDEMMLKFKNNGLDLSQKDAQEVVQLKKEIAALALTYSSNIAAATTTIHVDRSGLQGLEDDFIHSLKRTDDGQYILGVDYPTVYNVMDNCSVESTRKQLHLAFSNRAYPTNEPVLKNLIAKRDALGKKLGYASYADYDLSNQMAKTVQTVEDFMHDLLAKTTDKWKLEFRRWFADLPDGVQLTSDGMLEPWNVAYVKNHYKKKHFNIDEELLAQYFPMDHTIKGLLDIYEKFFSIKFKEVSSNGLWHEDVRLIETYDHEGRMLGYIVLDLYPRAGKYTHACCEHIIVGTTSNKESTPGFAIVVANFPKATESKPSLLTFNDASTFFHEFGHTLHALFARPHMSTYGGLNVKIDFAEMPSQMLEEWLWDKDILKGITRHYKTGEPLSDETIDNLIASKTFDSGSFLQNRLLFYAYISLELFKEGAQKDVHQMYKELCHTHKKMVAYEPQDHMYTSFGHLTEYGAKYYGYGWSKVFALDLFAQIKKHGLLNPEIGKKYVHDILSKGGGQDPMELLENFLGRKPNQEAFLQDLGLNK